MFHMHTVRSLSLSSASSSSSSSLSVGNVVVTTDDGQVHCFFGKISTATISSWTARLIFTRPWIKICERKFNNNYFHQNKIINIYIKMKLLKNTYKEAALFLTMNHITILRSNTEQCIMFCTVIKHSFLGNQRVWGMQSLL